METVVPSILLLKLNAIGVLNWVLGLILTAIPDLMAAAINPTISFQCDRFCSRWGRRIPALTATPFQVILLYREWSRLGGAKSYRPPRPELPDSANFVA